MSVGSSFNFKDHFEPFFGKFFVRSHSPLVMRKVCSLPIFSRAECHTFFPLRFSCRWKWRKRTWLKCKIVIISCFLKLFQSVDWNVKNQDSSAANARFFPSPVRQELHDNGVESVYSGADDDDEHECESSDKNFKFLVFQSPPYSLPSHVLWSSNAKSESGLMERLLTLRLKKTRALLSSYLDTQRETASWNISDWKILLMKLRCRSEMVFFSFLKRVGFHSVDWVTLQMEFFFVWFLHNRALNHW